MAENVYPNTIWMPEHGVQRGTIMNGDGDPLTPVLPATSELFPGRTFDEVRKFFYFVLNIIFEKEIYIEIPTISMIMRFIN